MTPLRNLLVAAATLLIAGCASEGYGGGYDGGYDGGYYGGGYGQYPQQGYYGYGPYGYSPYYGGGYAYGYDDDDYDHDSRRYFHPDDHVTCDRKHDICFDRYGPSYTATKRYLGERDANAAFHRYGDSVVLFSPQHGVTCDRRKQVCFDSDGIDDDLTDRYFRHHHSNFVGDAPTATRLLNSNGKSNNSGQGNPENMWWLNQRHRAAPLLNNDDDASQGMPLPRPQHFADDNDNVRIMQPVTRQADHSDRPAAATPMLRPTVIEPPSNRTATSRGGASGGGSGGSSATCLLNCESK